VNISVQNKISFEHSISN